MKKMNVKKTTIEFSNKLIQSRYFKLLSELAKIERMGTSQHFSILMKYFDAVRWYMFNEKNENAKRDFFKILCNIYKSDGNRHRIGFLEFYNYISKFNFYKSNNKYEILFRVMNHIEFKNLQLNNYNINPSWSSAVENTEKFAISQILMKEAKKSVLVTAYFKKEDIIYKFDSDENESEFLVKNGASPIFFGRLFDFNKGYIEKRLSLNIDEINITSSECRNSYGIFPTLNNKGFEEVSNREVCDLFVQISKRRIVNHLDNFIKSAA
jgi:hypothetical protein